MRKKGQSVLGLSFGALISIILIIMIVVIAIYAINHFMKLSQCSQVGSFYNELEKEVIKAWPSSGNYRGEYTGKVPKGGILRSDAEVVCFGNLEGSATSLSASFQTELRDEIFAPKDRNVFIYPPESACGGDFYSYKVTCQGSECLNVDDFFCVPVQENGDVTIFMQKTPTDSQVTIRQP